MLILTIWKGVNMNVTALQEGQVAGGVDTHQDLHVAAVVDHTGKVLGTRSFPTTRQGYLSLIAWMGSLVMLLK